MTRTYSFADIVAMTRRVTGTSETRITALTGRMKNLLKVGLLADVETSKGKATVYSEAQAFELLLATGLTLDGIAPTYVARLITANREAILRQIQKGGLFTFHPAGALNGQQAPRRTFVWDVCGLWSDMLGAFAALGLLEEHEAA